MNFLKQDKDGLYKSIFTAYGILLLHILLLGGAGLIVVLLKGVYFYLPWILAGVGLTVLGLGFVLGRRMVRRSDDIRHFLSMPELSGKTVEIKLLGGLASFKMSPENTDSPRLDKPSGPLSNNLLNEKTEDDPERKMLKLTALYEKDLITREEFETAKARLLQG